MHGKEIYQQKGEALKKPAEKPKRRTGKN